LRGVKPPFAEAAGHCIPLGMKKPVTILATCLLSFSVLGCFSTDVPKRPGDSNNHSGSARHADGLEVTWDAGSASVDGYIIRYGAEPQSLTEEVKVPVRDLRKEVDGEFGTVYRYVLRNVPQDTRVFVKIAAYRGKQISEFSEVKGELALK